MKQVRRTRVGADHVTDGAHPYVLLSEMPPEGGRFALQALTEKSEDGTRTVCLPHPTLPRYGLTLVGSADEFDRLSRLLAAAARSGSGDDDGPAGDAAE